MRSIAHFSTWICAEASQILCAEWEIRRASLGVKRFGKEVTMKMDFHTHGKLAKKLPFSEVYTNWLFAEAKRAGLDAICLTEHFNTLGFDRIYGHIKNSCDREGDTFVADGLRIFPGMETDIAEGGHILSIGPAEAILELNRRLEPHKEKGSFLPFAQLLALFR